MVCPGVIPHAAVLLFVVAGNVCWQAIDLKVA
jgi:hypothetical protein